MRHGSFVLTALIAAVWLGPGPAAAQTYSPPRTADGQPDLQGVWLSNSATPLERPKVLEGRARLTEAEVAEYQRRADRLFKNPDSDFATAEGVLVAVIADPGLYRNPNSTHSASDMVALEFESRTSLIMDPPDGRVPPLTPDAQRRISAAAAAGRRPQKASDLNDALRCLSWGVPRLGGRYGAGDMAYYQIVQTPGHVVLFMEAGHEARVIPLDGRPHLSTQLRQWSGDSRGRWEGNTLVVETTNFSPKSNFMGAREGLRLLERFTRVAPDRLAYEITLDDPTTWTRPWTAMVPLRQRNEPLFEFACHEGNYELMTGMLRAAFAQAQQDDAR
jgi:hypothetical protein